jgi:hypothetical protein
MNLIEQLFNDFNAKYLEEAKARNIDLGLQTVYTPIDKIEKVTGFRFADYINENTYSVAVLFNTEFISYFIKELPQNYINNIKFTFFYDCKFDYEQVKDCIFFSNNKLNIELVSIENINDLDKIMAGKKFDIIFSNPPYNGNLDLKILKSLFDQKISDKIVFVHPSSFLLDKKFNNKLYNELRNTNYLESVYMFWGNNLFNIELHSPCCISVWNTNKTTDECIVNDNAFINWTGNEAKYSCKINDISMHGKIINTYKHIFYVSDKYSSILEHRVKPDYSNITDISIKFSRLRGGNEYGKGVYSHFHSLLCLNTDSHKCGKNYRCKRDVDGQRLVWSFNTEKERDNFINYCKSKVIRFILSYYKNNVDLSSGQVLKSIPWIDFTKEWDDAKLCKEFGISKELWNYIDNFIPDFYDDYVSGFDK